MKKTVIIVIILTIIVAMFLNVGRVYGAEKAIDEITESKIVQIKENASNSLEDYKERYRSEEHTSELQSRE